MNNFISEQDKVEIVKIITKNGKGIRTSKPKVNKEVPNTGRAAYVWRMVMFAISKIRAHQCMPCTAEFDLCDADWKVRRDVINELEQIVSEIINKIPKSEWHGVTAWGRALGILK